MYINIYESEGVREGARCAGRVASRRAKARGKGNFLRWLSAIVKFPRTFWRISNFLTAQNDCGTDVSFGQRRKIGPKKKIWTKRSRTKTTPDWVINPAASARKKLFHHAILYSTNSLYFWQFVRLANNLKPLTATVFTMQKLSLQSTIITRVWIIEMAGSNC